MLAFLNMIWLLRTGRFLVCTKEENISQEWSSFIGFTEFFLYFWVPRKKSIGLLRNALVLLLKRRIQRGLRVGHIVLYMPCWDELYLLGSVSLCHDFDHFYAIFRLWIPDDVVLCCFVTFLKYHRNLRASFCIEVCVRITSPEKFPNVPRAQGSGLRGFELASSFAVLEMESRDLWVPCDLRAE